MGARVVVGWTCEDRRQNYTARNAPPGGDPSMGTRSARAGMDGARRSGRHGAGAAARRVSRVVRPAVEDRSHPTPRRGGAQPVSRRPGPLLPPPDQRGMAPGAQRPAAPVEPLQRAGHALGLQLAVRRLQRARPPELPRPVARCVHRDRAGEAPHRRYGRVHVVPRPRDGRARARPSVAPSSNCPGRCCTTPDGR